LAELADGLRFVRSKTFLLSMVLVATVGNFFDQPLLTVVAPVYGKEIYGSPESFGALVGSFGAGAFAGSLLFGAVGRAWPRRRIFLTSYLVGAALIYGTLALSPPLAVAILAAIAAGLAFGPVNPIFATVTQQNTPPQLLGRVFGALTAIAQAAIPIGAVVAGVVVQRAGLIPTILGMGRCLCRGDDRHVLQPGASGNGCPPRAGRRTDGRTSSSAGRPGDRFAHDGHPLMDGEAVVTGLQQITARRSRRSLGART
jgi:predicted MFS family arabinose efflux permease